MEVFLQSLIKKEDTIGVATSGGSDSMALLHYLNAQSKKQGFNVVAINVEHGIRGEESLGDSAFVKRYCIDNGIEFIFYQVNVPEYAKEHKLSIEQAGRILRYQCFENALKCGKCNKIATAHHLSDNAESVLLNALRGSGLKGLSGIAQNIDDKIIRPFLSVTKAQIMDYLKKHGLPYRTDSTNLDAEYTRNHIRLNVMPEIKKVFPEAELSLNRLADSAKIDDDYLQSVAQNSLTVEETTVSFSVDLHPAVASRCVITGLKTFGIERDWTKAHVEAVLGLKDLENGSRIYLPKGLLAIREYDRITLFKPTDFDYTPIPFKVGRYEFLYGLITIERVDEFDGELKNGFYLDGDKLSPSTTIRTLRTGDKFTKFGGGTKKLCDYFTDKKVPLRLRTRTPLIADDDQVYAIIGIGVSENAKIDQNTKTIYKITYKTI